MSKVLQILQYFWPALSENQSWKPILVFFLSDRLRQVVVGLEISRLMLLEQIDFIA